jgi:hypothetical protein
VQQRGVHGIRVVIGLVSLTHRHPAVAIEQACKVAQSHGAHRLRDIRNLLKRSEAPVQQQFEFVAEHPLIRSLERVFQSGSQRLRQGTRGGRVLHLIKEICL